MKNYLFLLIFCSSLFSFSFAQENNFVIGVIIDKNNGQPIPFATIAWEGKYLGVISNENGTFRLSTKGISHGTNLLISCIGYKTVLLPYSELNFNIRSVFSLSPKTFDIKEVVVKDRRKRAPYAIDIVKKAIEKIEDNYPVNTYVMEGYYRDYLKLEGNYLNMYEAQLQVEDQGILKYDFHTTKIKQLGGKMNPDIKTDSIFIVGYNTAGEKYIPNGSINYIGANEYAILRIHNPIRNFAVNSFDYINRLASDFIPAHQFRLKETVLEGEEYVYVIAFDYIVPEQEEIASVGMQGINSSLKTLKSDSKENEISVTANGLLYIGTDRHDIKRINYVVNMDTPESGNRKVWELNLEYKKIDGVSFLNYISFNNIVVFPDRRDGNCLYVTDVKFDLENEKLVFIFNNELNPKHSKSKNKYSLSEGGERLKISKVWIDKNKAHVYIDGLEPGFDQEKQINYELRNIIDIYGNKIDEVEEIVGYQYREFFTQTIETEGLVPFHNVECVDKRKSLVNAHKLNPEFEYNFNTPLLDM